MREVGVSRQCRGTRMLCKRVLRSRGRRFPGRQHLTGFGVLESLHHPRAWAWLLGSPPGGIPVFKENGAAGAKHLTKSFLSRAGTAGTQRDSRICKNIPVLGCPGEAGTPEDLGMRRKGERVSLHLRAASRLSALPALSKEAGGGGKTVTGKVVAIWARVQAGWQPPGLRSCRASGGAPHLTPIVLDAS